MNLLFDLDGTLVDPAAGIIASFAKGLEAVGLQAPPAKDLHWVIGPPLRQSFPQAGVPEHKVEAALAGYRVNYRGGAMFDATPYAGIAESLAMLQSAGHRMFVCTSKPHAFAKPIVEKFGFASRFAYVYGPELDGTRDDKGDLIAHILSEQTFDLADTLMIGDRKFDCLGAAKNGIKALGVAWGYGSRAELSDAGAVTIVDAPHDLAAAIGRV